MYCRICLNKFQNGEFISLLTQTDRVNWKKMCFDYLSINVNCNDECSTDICKRCAKLLKEFHEFREHALHCQKLIKQLHLKLTETDENEFDAKVLNTTQHSSAENDVVQTAGVIKLEKLDNYINLANTNIDNVPDSIQAVNEALQASLPIKAELVEEEFVIEMLDTDNECTDQIEADDESVRFKEESCFEMADYEFHDSAANETYPHCSNINLESTTQPTEEYPKHKKFKANKLDESNSTKDTQHMEESQTNSKKRQTTDSSLHLDEAKFRKIYRLSTGLTEFLIQKLDAQLRGTRVTATSTDKMVLATLRFYSTGCTEGDIGELFDIKMPPSAVKRAIHKVTDAINAELCQKYIRFPMTNVEREAAKNVFSKAAAPFNGAIGAIDCMQVGILPPRSPADTVEAFLNKKRYHSINVQMICDPTLKILNVNARHPGSKENAYIWNASAVRRAMHCVFDSGEQNTFLIGDANYPLEPWLMTPLQNVSENTPEACFNDALYLAHKPVKRLFDVIRRTWRCLGEDKLLLQKPQFVGRIVNAISVLHNLQVNSHECIADSDDTFEDNFNPYEYTSPSPIIQLQDTILLNTAKRIQHSIVREYFSNRHDLE